MTRLKKIFFALVLFMAMFFVTSCNDTPAPSNSNVNKDISMSTITKSSAGLMSISVDSTNSKTEYFLGEKFDSTGLKVTATFVEYIDGQRVSTDVVCTSNITIDDSLVDMYVAGVYPVTVTYRKGVQTQTTTYTIKVRSNILGVSNVKYIGGLDVKLTNKAGKEIQTVDTLLFSDYYFNPTFTIKYYQNEQPYNGGANDIEIDVDKLEITGLDQVNVNKAGSYLVRFVYTGPKVVIDGKEYENKVSTFVVFNVYDRVTKISFYAGETEFGASINDFTYSDWYLEVTREVSGEKITKYNPSIFTISGVNQYVAGYQNATISHNENGVSTVVEIKVTPSANVKLATNFESGFEAYTANNSAVGTYTLDNGGFVKAKLSKIAAGSSLSNADVSFTHKVTIKSSDWIEVTLDKAATVIVYFTTTGTDSRNLFYLDEESGEYLAYAESTEDTKMISKLTITFDKAGSYRFNTESSGIYLYGVVIGYI